MKAALAGRTDPGLTIAGRTSALSVTGVEDAIERVRAYEAVGVDAVFLVGAKTRDQIDAVAAAVSVPIILGGTTPEIQDLDYLSARGVRLCLQGHQPFAAGVRAVYETLKALREGTKPAELTGIADAALMARVTRNAAYKALIEETL